MSAPLWVAPDVHRALRLVSPVSSPQAFYASGVAIDSRRMAWGDIFIALKGERDGADFAADAVAKGAQAVIAERPILGLTVPVLVVRDSYQALWDLGHAGRARSRATRIGITGSCGKTSVKQALALCLRSFGVTYMAPESFNNHIGLPLSLANLPPHARYGVFELGMNHAGEIADLTSLLRPQFALITNIAPAHLENFVSLNAIADAKAEIFSAMSGAAVALLPWKSKHYARLARAASRAGVHRIIAVGRPNRRHIAQPITGHGRWVTAQFGTQAVQYYLPQLGRHAVDNSVMVLACVAALGEDIGRAAHALEGWQAPRGRGVHHRLALRHGTCLLIDDSYNANPASMLAALEALAQCRHDGQTQRTIAVLGDMLELGARAPQAHRQLARALKTHSIARVYLCGPLMKHLWAVLPSRRKGAYARRPSDLLPSLRHDLKANDAVMVKGSRALALDNLVADLLATQTIKTGRAGAKGLCHAI